ncbi:MAG TPA: hypothetical protein VFM94_11240 [Solirubrobacterales bacterium]|nr:hypothetical protein [Solirubrobacterales bacterium]
MVSLRGRFKPVAEGYDCLKVHSSGRRIVYVPDLVLFHFESSRRVAAVDPYNNPNLHRGVPRLTANFGWARRKRMQLPWQLRQRLSA